MEDGVWSASLRLPPDAYVEYVYLHAGWRVPDPFNPREVSNGLGGANNYFYMPEGRETLLAKQRPDTPRGTLKRHTLNGGQFVIGGERAVYLYWPPTDDPVPLLVVYDGEEYRRQARLHIIVENLIAQGRIRPVALAMVSHGGSARLAEYACNEGTVAFVTEKLVPFARDHLSLLDPAEQPGAYGVVGASMGGLMALYTALRAPDIFGQTICQSSTVLASVFGRDPVVFELARQRSSHPLRIWMDAGNLETLGAANRRLRDTLLLGGHKATFHAYNGGHNYTAWRDDVWRGLETLFGQGTSPTTPDAAGDGEQERDALASASPDVTHHDGTHIRGETAPIARAHAGRRRRAHAREDGPNATGD